MKRQHPGDDMPAQKKAKQPTHKLLIRNASQIVTVSANGAPVKRGIEMKELGILTNASVVVNMLGLIEAVDTSEEIDKRYADAVFETEIDATGKSVVPGLCDGHTHPVFAGDRVHEFAMKLAGATYMEVHAKGGGINFTVSHTRSADEDSLVDSFRARLDRMMRQGTTMVEAKSGYGLDLETEAKMLRVLKRGNDGHALRVISNYCGAHSVPKGSTAEEACKDIVEVQIPALVDMKAKGEIEPTLIDVFMEKGVFGREETRKILEAGVAAGMAINFHGDELHPTGSAELAGELGALAVSHLEEVTDEGIAALAKKPTVAVLLPTTAHILRLKPPPARKMIDAGIPVALGSDFNPNAHCLSMPFVMNAACVLFRLSMPEALVAATLNSAASMGMSDTHGSIEVGKQGDFVIIGADDWQHLIYELVDPPIASVVVRGSLVWESPALKSM